MTKKVLLATRPLVPPWDEASKNFAYFLGREIRDHSLTLLTAGSSLPGLPPLAQEMPIYESAHFDIRAKLSLLAYLRSARNAFDVTHYLFTPTLSNTRLIRLFARPTHGKTVQTVATLRRDLYSDEALQDLLFADRVVVYTDASRRHLESLGKTNVERIYPGIDLEKYAPRPKSEALLSEYGLDPSHFVVVYPGEYARLGATDLLADTFLAYFAEHPDTPLRLFFACRVKNAEDANKKAEVEARFKKAGLDRYVIFTDTRADMPSLYNTADVVIFPVANLKGKFDVPLVIIEAYASGKPVILSDLPAFGEFTGVDFSVRIPKSSGSALLDSLAYLRENQAVRERLGKAARAFVEERFDLKKTAREYTRLYSSL